MRPTSTTSRSRPSRPWVARLALLGFGVLAGVVLAEATLWILAPVRYHEWMLWVPDGYIKGRAEPGQVVHTAEGHPVRINRLGFRGPDRDWVPAGGTLRLAAFGGSSTFCFDSSGEENTWPELLARKLSTALHMPVEVINLGLPGFDSFTSKVNYLVTGRALHPDVALLYETWNDLKKYRRLEQQPQVFTAVAASKPLWQRIARATQIGRHVRNLLAGRRLIRTENYYTSLEKEGERAHSPVQQVAYDWSRQSFRDFCVLTQADGVLPVLITQATIAVPENLQDHDYRLRMGTEVNWLGMTLSVLVDTWIEMNRILAEVAAQSGAVLVDGYAAVPHDFEHLNDHVHLTDRGCETLAEAIAAVLLKEPRFLEAAERVRRR